MENIIKEGISGASAKGKVLTNRELEEQLMMIKKYVNSAIKPAVMAEFEQGTIRLVYAPEDVKRVRSLPFALRPVDGKVCVDVYVHLHGNMRQDGQVSVNYRRLYNLMETAYLAKKFVMGFERYKNNSAIIQQGCILYSNMFVKPINKKFNLHVDMNRENKVRFLSAKFYLKNVLGMQNDEVVFNTAMKACKGGNPLSLRELDMIFPEEAFTNLGTFIDALKDDRLSLGLGGLTVRGYLDSYIGLYGDTTILALELFPYFLFVGHAALNDMNLVRNNALEDIMEKGMPKLIGQLY
jgi:hypothetical protein